MPGYSFSQFWRRLGYTGAESFPLNRTLQPVIVTADCGNISPFFDVPCGVWAVAGGAVAGQYAGALLRANNPGGVILKWWTAFNRLTGAAPAGTDLNWVVDTMANVLAQGGPQATGAVKSANPTRPTTATAGTYHGATNLVSALAAPADVAHFQGGDTVAAPPLVSGHLMGEVWIPPGSALVVQSGIVAQGITVSGWFIELAEAGPAPPP